MIERRIAAELNELLDSYSSAPQFPETPYNRPRSAEG